MATTRHFVICIDNDGYGASLETRKIYLAKRDPESEAHGLLRITDESGSDYLYPKTLFKTVTLPQALQKAVLAA